MLGRVSLLKPEQKYAPRLHQGWVVLSVCNHILEWPLSFYSQFESRRRWRGRMRNEPCQIGSIRPRRQALERRTLHPTRPTVPSGKQWFQSSNNWLSRFVNLHTRRWRGQMQKDDKPHWLHKSATPSPRATYTPDFQIHKPNFPRRLHNNFPKQHL